jgi:hypothetical protein
MVIDLNELESIIFDALSTFVGHENHYRASQRIEGDQEAMARAIAKAIEESGK